MNTTLRSHADVIVKASIAAVQPDAAVQRALSNQIFPGRVLLVAAGKAVWIWIIVFIVLVGGLCAAVLIRKKKAS